MDAIKGIVNKVASRKLAVTAVAGAAAITGTIEANLAAGGGGYVERLRRVGGQRDAACGPAFPDCRDPSGVERPQTVDLLAPGFRSEVAD